MVVNQILKDSEARMKKQIEGVRREFTGIRSGKASPALLDTVKVEAYGQPVPLQQVGSVSAPEARLLVIQPWDKALVKAVSKAIQQSEFGLNPTDDGTVVRVPIPMLTEERRKDLVKVVARMAEEGRVHVRAVRHDANKTVKQKETGGEISQDEAKRLLADIQKLTDHHVGLVDELLEKKTVEIMEV
jgi:ribosome recycling factor